jgi:bifunctional DNA-binding transcriptional regulator/antitoxin component of YhaV-PrlF toxin-antitoxin module
MKNDIVRVDQAGRILLTKAMRRELAIKAGDTFKVSIKGMAITLTPNKESAGFVRKGRALVFSTGGSQSLDTETVRAR